LTHLIVRRPSSPLCFIRRPPPTPTLFPYTTLFRSRSCVTPVSRAANKKVVTIEGLSPDLRHPLQMAWIEADVPQCGYCQSGDSPDRKSTRLNSSHGSISYAVFCLKKKKYTR